MKEEEKRLAAEIEALLFRADQIDLREDEQFGRGQGAEDLPAEFQRRDARLRRIHEAKAALEKEAAEARARRDDDNDDGSGAAALPSHRVPSTPSGAPSTRAAR